MCAITVRVDQNSLEQSKSQTISGVIYFDFEDHQFPEVGWNDFVVVVLNWWLSGLLNILLRKSTREDLRFMDGPFFIGIERIGDDLCNVFCLDAGAEDNTEFSGQYKLSEIMDSVLRTARDVYVACERNSWGGDDITELKKLLKHFSDRLV